MRRQEQPGISGLRERQEGDRAGLTFILANTDLDWSDPARLGTAWGEAKKDWEDSEPFSSQSGRAEAMMTITADSSRSSVERRLPSLDFTRRGCCLKGVRRRSRPRST